MSIKQLLLVDTEQIVFIIVIIFNPPKHPCELDIIIL